MITDIEDYFAKGCDRCPRFATPDCAVRIWAAGLADLRAICLDLGLVECVKWGHPCYMHADRNIAVFGAFRKDFRISFMNVSLLTDTHNVLEPIGPNSQSRSVLRFRTNAEVAVNEPIIRNYLRDLMTSAEQGIKPIPKHQAELILADELVNAMDTDPILADAFIALTPGRRRGWSLHFSGAKQSATRDRRIAKARSAIIAGKGWNER